MIGSHTEQQVNYCFFFLTSGNRQDACSIILDSVPSFPLTSNILSALWPVHVYHQEYSFAVHSYQMLFSILLGLFNFNIYLIYSHFFINIFISNEISFHTAFYFLFVLSGKDFCAVKTSQYFILSFLENTSAWLKTPQHFMLFALSGKGFCFVKNSSTFYFICVIWKRLLCSYKQVNILFYFSYTFHELLPFYQLL